MNSLHQAIIQVLKEHNKEMKYSEIAIEINKRKLYVRKDGELLSAQQVQARCSTKQYSRLFQRLKGGQVKL